MQQRLAKGKSQAGIAARYRMADAVAFAGIEEQHLIRFGDSLVLPKVPHINTAIRKYQVRRSGRLLCTQLPAAALAVHVLDCNGLSLQKRVNGKF